ncbi:putative ATP-dependent RNA helicase TDRD12 [Parambassis ranga]|uniref:RNA helicase n=1 Tax=Parambassis ranga TaxID=210632 RepID=A0A6P7IN07_9TELE|nr:putative ATP-dependent RNA helicase TDRD12 [Parambassis ranga]
MLKISILKVEDPSCLWGRVVQGLGSNSHTREHNNMLTQMSLFYHDVTKDQSKLKPKSLKEGQVYVVYWSVMKSWCRAVVEAIIVDSVSCQARCLLVDHGEQLIVPSDQIRVAMQDFLQLPFWVRKFHLARIKPITLRVPVYEEKAKLIPSSHWDGSATLYLHNLLQASTRTEAVLLESESVSTSIELYLTINNIKICVNDDLVAKKFAYYSRQTAGCGSLDEVDRIPAMLTSSILTPTVSVSNTLSAQTQPPPVTSQALNEAGDCQTSASPQSQQPGLDIMDTSNPAATESDSSEDTDASLAAALTKNLNLFRFLKFLNPESTYQQSASRFSQTEEPNDCQPKGMTATFNACAEQELFLEWLNPVPLNPRPLNPELDTADSEVLLTDPRRSGILVHSAVPVKPCNSLADAPITEALHQVLQRKQYTTLSPADCYSWPALTQGCNTVIISQNADQPLNYLTPLLTHILLNSIHVSHTASSGPIVVLLCSGWEKVQVVYDFLEESKIIHILHPVVVLLGIGKDESKSVKIPKNCHVILTTPFSLVRLLSCQCFSFLRIYHLVLDEADQLFTLAQEQMETILQHFQKVTSSEKKASCPQQLVAVAKRWIGHMDSLLANHMPCPYIVITVPEEAALYGNVQQVILMTLESNKISVLLGALDFNPDVGQKTLIVTNSIQEVEDVYKAVKNKSAFCLKTHEGITHEFDFVIQQWRRNISSGTQVILVTTNECVKALGIRDATCVVHYGFPSSPNLFGRRLFCMAENFRNLSEQDQTESKPPAIRSVLLISEKNTRHVIGVLRYLGRTSSLLPPELLSFAKGVHVAREDLKTNRHLCSYLKSFGVCRDSSVCPDRHRINSQLDLSDLPASGVIEVVPLFIKTASVFYGRIIRKEDEGFDTMASEMASFYAVRKPVATELVEGHLYAVEQDEVFHRVKILSVPDRGDSLFFSVFVQFIDVGKEEEVKSYQILQLPEQFRTLSGQAVEIIVCRVKPLDAETNWHPKVTRAISQKIRNQQHRARAVFSLGNTVFVDPMVRVTKVPGMKTLINEYNVQSEILSTGMGVKNPEHLDLLRALHQEGLSGSSEKVAHMSEPGDGVSSLEVRIKLEEEALAEVFRVAGARKLATLDVAACVPEDPEELLKPVVSSTNQSLVQAPPALEVALKNPVWENKSQTENEQRNTHPADSKPAEQKESYHPHVHWYQTVNCAVARVILVNPESQRCDFFSDRVIYSGRVNGRHYRADLELYQNIVAKQCCWEMKSNQPVLKLVKQQQGHWERLVRSKNIFVSHDMDHLDDEEETPNGLCFMGNTGEDNCYVNSESGSESD